MPHTCQSRYPSGAAQLGGNPTYVCSRQPIMANMDTKTGFRFPRAVCGSNHVIAGWCPPEVRRPDFIANSARWTGSVGIAPTLSPSLGLRKEQRLNDRLALRGSQGRSTGGEEPGQIFWLRLEAAVSLG